MRMLGTINIRVSSLQIEYSFIDSELSSEIRSP